MKNAQAAIALINESSETEGRKVIIRVRKNYSSETVNGRPSNMLKGPYVIVAREFMFPNHFYFEETEDQEIRDLWFKLVKPWIEKNLKPGVHYSSYFKGSKEHNLKTYEIVVSSDADIVMDLSKPEDALKYIVLATSSYCIGDRDGGQVLEVINQQKEATRGITRREKIQKCLEHLSKQDPSYKRRLVRLVGFFQNSMSNEQIDDELGKLALENPERYLELVEDAYLDLKMDVKELVAYQVVSVNQYKAYMIGTGPNAQKFNTETHFIEFLKDPKNTDAYSSLMNQLEMKKNSIAEPKKRGPKAKE